jgi:hypothetical protein
LKRARVVLDVKTRALLLLVAPLALASCSIIGPSDGPTISVSFSTSGSSNKILTSRVQVNGDVIPLTPTAAGNWQASLDYHASRYGQTSIRVTLTNATGDSLAAITDTFNYERGNLNWIASTVLTSRPVGFCLGSVKAAAVKGTVGDSLFVMIGAIPENAVC